MDIRIPRPSANFRSYLRHFGRPLLIILGVLVVVGLAAGTYFYGDKKRDESGHQASNSEEQNKQASQSGQDNQDSARSNSTPSNTQAPSTTNPQTASPGHPNTGPTVLSNTGPEDWSLPIIISLCVLASLYRRSQRELDQSLQAV